MKARILVTGNVQGVGYRALLLHMARRLKIKGLTRNLKDGNVEIFCEGPKENIGQFLKAIEVKGDPKDLFSLHVEGTECFWEGEEGYQEPWKPYEDFEIDYGVRISEYQYLAMEDREYGKLYLSNLRRAERDKRRDSESNSRTERDNTRNPQSNSGRERDQNRNPQQIQRNEDKIRQNLKTNSDTRRSP